MAATKIKAVERFFAKVEKTDSCWLWRAAKNGWGYGYFHLDGKDQRAHRVAYEMLVGPVPEGLELDHLCRNKLCVNPAHLEPVLHSVNIRRGPNPERDRTHCPRGHEYNEENTYLQKRHNGLHRICRACYRIFRKQRRPRVSA